MGYGERGTATGRNLNTRMDPEKKWQKNAHQWVFRSGLPLPSSHPDVGLGGNGMRGWGNGERGIAHVEIVNIKSTPKKMAKNV